MHDEWKFNLPNGHANDWLYIGADIYSYQWSKIGKTTCGLDSRHTSSQRPGYFIYAAYNIRKGMVHKLEKELLLYLDSRKNITREIHFSTGNDSECFIINPAHMVDIVESFIHSNYSSFVTYENWDQGQMSRYECEVFDIYSQELRDQPQQLPILPFDNLGMSKELYFTGNTMVYETDLGGGVYHCHITNRQRHINDED